MARVWENSAAYIRSWICWLQPMKTSDISKQICHTKESKNISQWHFIHGKYEVWHHICTASLKRIKNARFQKKFFQFPNYFILLSWILFFFYVTLFALFINTVKRLGRGLHCNEQVIPVSFVWGFILDLDQLQPASSWLLNGNVSVVCDLQYHLGAGPWDSLSLQRAISINEESPPRTGSCPLMFPILFLIPALLLSNLATLNLLSKPDDICVYFYLWGELLQFHLFPSL